MKQTIFTFLLFAALGLASCRKDKTQLSIKQYDQQQIENYIAANHISGMIRDTSGGDTTGMYYKIIMPGSGTALGYADEIKIVNTVRSFDGNYTSADTILNHFYNYMGHIYSSGLPNGLQSIVHNVLKYPGASMRVLIPSHLAYGINGKGSGSSQVANNRIAGNQCLDYYVHLIGNLPTDQATYDDQVIKNYMNANGLSGYSTDTVKGYVGKYYYKVLTQPTGTVGEITDNSTATATYTTQLFNKTLIDSLYNGTNYATLTVSSLVPGVSRALINHAATGTKISLLIPSNMAYGLTAETGIPYYSCLRFTFAIISKTP